MKPRDYKGFLKAPSNGLLSLKCSFGCALSRMDKGATMLYGTGETVSVKLLLEGIWENAVPHADTNNDRLAGMPAGAAGHRGRPT
jgi:hypothetical protein